MVAGLPVAIVAEAPADATAAVTNSDGRGCSAAWADRAAVQPPERVAPVFSRLSGPRG